MDAESRATERLFGGITDTQVTIHRDQRGIVVGSINRSWKTERCLNLFTCRSLNSTVPTS